MRKLIGTAFALGAMVVLTIAFTGTSGLAAPAAEKGNAQISQLYKLQAAFHRAASVRSVDGDSASVIDQRIADMLSLWAPDGSLTLQVGNPRDGQYIGRGDLATNCPAPSTDAANRGTLCTFFKYVAGSFQPQNKLVSLSPSYKTSFVIHGITSTVYFECHYFNVATGADGKPLWTPASHVQATGTAKMVKGVWLFDHLDAPIPAVPLGS